MARNWRVTCGKAALATLAGLPCDACNTGIGKLQHDPDIFMTAARCLMKHRQKEDPYREKPGAGRPRSH